MQISQALADSRLTGFALWGIGGIGKTALARASARRNAWRYQAAVWVDIRDARQKTAVELLRLALCRLQNAPALIVLDNLEDLPDAAHYVQHVARQKECRTLKDASQLREENGELAGLCVRVARWLHGHPKMLELAVGVALQGPTALEQALVALPDELEQQLAAMLATSLACVFWPTAIHIVAWGNAPG